jgi:DNA-binding response OmpR family regulator
MAVRVLLARESADWMRAQKILLREAGYEVLTASSAEDALKTYERGGADFLAVDLDLPLMGGDGLCSRIREEDNRVYVCLMCSGKKPELRRCGNCGANSFMKDPVDAEELTRRVDLILKARGRRATRVLARVRVEGYFRSEPFFCTSRDISETGILLETDRTLAKGDRITSTFFLPDTERLEVRGSVVRITKGEDENRCLCGVEFEDMDAGEKSVIQEFVECQKKDGNFF